MLKLRRQWVGKNVDLVLLDECIGNFFKQKGFKVRRDRSAREYTILAVPLPQRSSDLRIPITVKILGRSNDFVIELIAREKEDSSIRLGFLTTLIGGGGLLLRGLKSREALERLEKEFWVFAEDIVARLAGSAECS